MKIESRIGPMILVKIKRVKKIETKYSIKYSIKYYTIILEGARLAVTDLHAFKVMKNGKFSFENTSQLKENDLIWIDESAFTADGSLIKRGKNEIFNICFDTIVTDNS